MTVPNVQSVHHYNQLVSGNKYLVLNFTASWCGPCKAIKPLVDQTYDKLTHMELARVDLDTQPELASQFKVSSIPTFVFLENKVEVDRVTGASNGIRDSLEKFNGKAKRGGGKRSTTSSAAGTTGRGSGTTVGGANGGNRNTSGTATGQVKLPLFFMQMDHAASSIKNIPPVTRFFTVTTLFICLLNGFKLIDLSVLMCDFDVFYGGFYNCVALYKLGVAQFVQAVLVLLLQSYRFLSAFLVPHGVITGEAISAIMDIYFFYTFANHLESSQGKFKRNFPDCLWFTLITGTMIVGLSFCYFLYDPLHHSYHHEMMLSCVTYLWSRSSKNSVINFLGVVPIKGYYLPFFNLGLKLIVQGYDSLVDSLFGIIGGYLYQCIASHTWPIYNLFPDSYGQVARSNSGNRVGMNWPNDPNYIDDSIFDKGYLKAPIWLYKQLNYPINNSKRHTAFTKVAQNNVRDEGSTTGYETPGFQGKGYRLGG